MSSLYNEIWWCRRAGYRKCRNLFCGSALKNLLHSSWKPSKLMSRALNIRTILPANRLEINTSGHIAPEAILFEDVDDDQYVELLFACGSSDDSIKSEIHVAKYDAVKYTHSIIGQLTIKHSVVSLLFDDVLNSRTGKKQLLILCSDGVCNLVEISPQPSCMEKLSNLNEKSTAITEVHTPTNELKQTNSSLRGDDVVARNDILSFRTVHEMRIMMNARHSVCVDIDRDGSNELLIAFANVVPQVKVYRFSLPQIGRSLATTNSEQQSATVICLRTIEVPAPITSRLLVYRDHSVVFAFERSLEEMTSASSTIRVGFIEMEIKLDDSQRAHSDMRSYSGTGSLSFRTISINNTFEAGASSGSESGKTSSGRIIVDSAESANSQRRAGDPSAVNKNKVNFPSVMPSHRVEMTILRRRCRTRPSGSPGHSLLMDDNSDTADEYEQLFAFAFGSMLVATDSTGRIEWFHNVTLPETPIATAPSNGERTGANTVPNLFCLDTVRLESISQSPETSKAFRLHWNKEDEEDFLCVSAWSGDALLVDANGRFATRFFFPERCCAARWGLFASPPNANMFLVRAAARRSRMSSGRGDADDSGDLRMPLALSNRVAIAFVTFDYRLLLEFGIALPQRAVFSQSLIQRIRNGSAEAELLDKAGANVEHEHAEDSKLVSSTLQKWISAKLYSRVGDRTSERA